MDSDWIRVQLREAVEELSSIIDQVGDLSEVELEIALAHAYRHINAAWHGRNGPGEVNFSIPGEIAAPP